MRRHPVGVEDGTQFAKMGEGRPVAPVVRDSDRPRHAPRDEVLEADHGLGLGSGALQEGETPSDGLGAAVTGVRFESVRNVDDRRPGRRQADDGGQSLHALGEVAGRAGREKSLEI